MHDALCERHDLLAGWCPGHQLLCFDNDWGVCGQDALGELRVGWHGVVRGAWAGRWKE
jgi:hypothetical protein